MNLSREGEQKGLIAKDRGWAGWKCRNAAIVRVLVEWDGVWTLMRAFHSREARQRLHVDDEHRSVACFNITPHLISTSQAIIDIQQ